MFSKIIDRFKAKASNQTTDERNEDVTTTEPSVEETLEEMPTQPNGKKRFNKVFLNTQLINLKQFFWLDDNTIQINKQIISGEAILRFHAGHRLPMVVDFKVGETYRRLLLGLSDIKEEEMAGWTERIWVYLIAHNPSLKKVYDLMCLEEKTNGEAYYQRCLWHFLELTRDKHAIFFNFPGNRRAVQRIQDQSFLIQKIVNLDIELHRDNQPSTLAQTSPVEKEIEIPKVASVLTTRFLIYEDDKVTLNGEKILSLVPYMVTFMCTLWCPSLWTITLENGDRHYLFTTNKKELDPLQDLIIKPVQIHYLRKQYTGNEYLRQLCLPKIATVRENIIFNKFTLDVDEHEAIVAWLDLLENEGNLGV